MQCCLRMTWCYAKTHAKKQKSGLNYGEMQLRTREYESARTIQYNTIQYNTIQYNTIQYNTIQYNTMQCNAMRCGAVRCGAVQPVQCSTVQYNLLLNLKGSFFEPAVGSLPNFARVCGYRRY